MLISIIHCQTSFAYNFFEKKTRVNSLPCSFCFLPFQQKHHNTNFYILYKKLIMRSKESFYFIFGSSLVYFFIIVFFQLTVMIIVFVCRISKVRFSFGTFIRYKIYSFKYSNSLRLKNCSLVSGFLVLV